MNTLTDRRAFLKGSTALAVAGSLPMTVVATTFARAESSFSFACISDAHIQQIRGSTFASRRDHNLIQAVAEVNRLEPKPDFVVFGGDLAQLGRKAELDHGAEILSALRLKTRPVMGEHDYYLDLGTHWSRLFGPQWYSFDHKGVHFIALNSVLTHEDWIFDRWPDARQRMLEMTRLGSPNGSPFLVGREQCAWLARDLEAVRRDTPIVVLSHAPLQKIHRGWNFWTDDAEEVQALLQPFDQVHVFYGHVHQARSSQIGNISFHSMRATAWPWPDPQACSPAQRCLPRLALPADQANPFFGHDTTGWQLIQLAEGATIDQRRQP